MKKQIIGIMGAMPEEIDGVKNLLTNCTEKVIGMRTFTTGKINGIDTVVVFSRWGKVAAAATATTLILEFGITELFFTGVAGAIHPDLKIGDIVVAKRLIQHDMDARPLMQQYEIPLLGRTFFEADNAHSEIAINGVRQLLGNNGLHGIIDAGVLNEFGILNPQLFIGDIASGDKFFANREEKRRLIAAIPSVMCVEMEGAAVAQVCYEYELPFSVIRTISDTADDQSHIDFVAFIRAISSHYAVAIMDNIYKTYKTGAKSQ